MRLSIIHQHFKQGFSSVLRLVEQLEMEIENLTLAQSSKHHDNSLSQTINNQKLEIERLSRTLENKSQQLLNIQRINFELQKECNLHPAKEDRLNNRWQHKVDKLQIRLVEAQQINQQLQTKIRALEECLESDAAPPAKLDSHNSSLPPSLDPPWNKPKQTRSLRTRSGLKVGGQIGHKGYTLHLASDPDSIIVHRVDVCHHCQNSLIPVESRHYQKRQIFEIENGRLMAIEHRIEIKSCWVCHQVTKGIFPNNLKAPVQYESSVLFI